MTNVSLRGNINYAAQVFKVPSLQKAENSDRLFRMVLAGMSVIVDESWIDREGQQMVVFPAESQLAFKLAHGANLHRHAELNKDPNDAGYLEDNLRVRAIRLRGNASNALVLPLEKVESIYGPLNVSAGDVFDHIGDEEVVKKYEPTVKKPRANREEQRRKKVFKRVIGSMLPEHYDTANIRFAPTTIDDDTVVYVTQKLHGCFPYNTPVRMWDGSIKNISKVGVGDVVVGYDNGVPVPSEVRAAFTTGSTDTWVRTKYKNPLKGDNPIITSTPDHKILTQKGYVSAEDLIPGEHRVYYTRFQEIVTPEKAEILRGIIMGDGHVNPQGAVSFSHKADHVEYIEYKVRLLGNLATGLKTRLYTSGYGTPMVRANTKHLQCIRDVVEDFRGRRIPEGFRFSDESLAILYMDDGSLSHSERRANFAVCAYSGEDTERIRKALVAYGFSNPVVYNASGYTRIRLNKDDAELLFSRIRHLVPECMEYKLPAYHRGYFEEPILPDEYGPVLIETDILSSERISPDDRFTPTKYDLTTSTGNFVAHGAVVHNSSARIANVPTLVKPTVRNRLAKFFGVPVKDTVYDVIGGSRRVIKDAHDPYRGPGFYGEENDIWAQAVDRWGHLIPKGFAVYGELIGWAGDKPIQRGYTYNLPQGEMEFYVYRVAVITPDAEIVDLPWPRAQQWCAERGLKTVPTMREEVFPVELGADWRLDEFLKPLAFYKDTTLWADDPVPLSEGGPGVDEGYGFRYEYPNRQPEFFKIKFPEFLEHETKVLDANEEILS